MYKSREVNLKKACARGGRATGVCAHAFVCMCVCVFLQSEQCSTYGGTHTHSRHVCYQHSTRKLLAHN